MDIKNILKKHGYTIQSAADKMGKERVTLSRTISKNPTVGTLRKLAEATGIPFWEFFSDEIPDGVKSDAAGTFECPNCHTRFMVTKVEDGKNE